MGTLAGPPCPDGAGPVVPVRLTLLAEPVDRAELLAAVLDRISPERLGPWLP